MSDMFLHLSLTIGIITESVRELGKKPCTIKALKHIASKVWISGLAYNRCSADRESIPQALFTHKEAMADLKCY